MIFFIPSNTKPKIYKMSNEKTNIYILKLRNNKYYIGKSKNPQKRFEEHIKGDGSSWTSLYKPIQIEKIISDASPFDEDKYVKIYMEKYGVENVRGGSYSEVELDEVQEEALEREIRGATDACTRCGRKGHFIKDCYARSDVNGNEFDDSDDSEEDDYDSDDSEEDDYDSDDY